MKSVLAVSAGDASGIGPEIILKAWAKRHEYGLPPFMVLADPDLLKARAARFSIPLDIKIIEKSQAYITNNSALSVYALKNRQKDAPGIPLVENAAATIEAIERSVHLVHQGAAKALVTCPIAKKPLYDAGFPFPGHTEFLGSLADTLYQGAFKPVMMLAGPQLKTVPITVHIALHNVMDTLTSDLICETARIVYKDLQNRFQINHPRLAMAGLNPHAGEDGTMGHEEIDVIQPAIKTLRSEGIHINGPLPADTMFHDHARRQYDAALCMYHDQALIPVKTIGFDDTVNVTLGLPFIRTSPDHGTAFDIAEKGIANPASFIAALKMAWKMGDGKNGH